MQAKLAFLQQPESYGRGADAVECIETHMSWVFVVGERVYKLKKPVRLALLDFTSLQARAHFCHEEVRLNARLAPGIYLGVLALQWHRGTFALLPEGSLPAPGHTVDWLVLMRKFPRDKTLAHLLRCGSVTRAHVDALAALLGDFYRHAPTVPLSADSYLQRFAERQAINRNLLLRPELVVPEAPGTLDRLDAAVLRCADLLGARATQGHLREGHGDLRPDHVVFLQPPVVVDCLEFCVALRQLDPMDELSYLRLECGMAGAAWVGERLLAAVAQALHDTPTPALLHVYAAHHAVLRARLAVSHLLDPMPRTPDKWRPLAARYLARANTELDAIG